MIGFFLVWRVKHNVIFSRLRSCGLIFSPAYRAAMVGRTTLTCYLSCLLSWCVMKRFYSVLLNLFELSEVINM